MNLIENLQTAFMEAIAKHYELTQDQTKNITLSFNLDESKQAFGDLSSNAALIIGQVTKQSPRAIAQEIQSLFKHITVEKINSAGPGFLNFFLTTDALKAITQELYEHKDAFFKLSNDTNMKNYSIEFVSANPTGPLHLGHGRGGIIGDVLGNIMSFLGHSVTKEFYINDAGSQIQKLGNSFKIRCQQETGNKVELPEDGYQGEYLVHLAKSCIKEHGENVIQKDNTFFADYAREHLLSMIKQTLTDYGVTFDVWFSEKTLHESGSITKALDKLKKGGYTYEKDGALWFTSTMFHDDKDRVLRKKSGELTYIAADIAYMADKLERGFEHLIFILGQDHHSYATRLKGIMEATGNNPDNLEVILYQLVSLQEGGQQLRMSKRAGRMVTLKDVIDTVGKDVARFFYLHRKADAHLDFNLDLALKRTDENPVYYLQYAYVRTKSILKKAQAIPQLTNITAEDLAHITRSEATLLKKIVSLKHLLATIASSNQTHLLTYYSIELAQVFHNYYAHHRVIEENKIEQSRGRLAMISILQETFELVLTLLGLSKPDSM